MYLFEIFWGYMYLFEIFGGICTFLEKIRAPLGKILATPLPTVPLVFQRLSGLLWAGLQLTEAKHFPSEVSPSILQIGQFIFVIDVSLLL